MARLGDTGFRAGGWVTSLVRWRFPPCSSAQPGRPFGRRVELLRQNGDGGPERASEPRLQVGAAAAMVAGHPRLVGRGREASGVDSGEGRLVGREEP